MLLAAPGGTLLLISPLQRQMVARTWAFRTRAERESTLRFARLSRELSDLSAPLSIVALATRAAHDEHRHAQLCAAVCARYGGVPPRDPAHDHPARWPGLSPRDQTLYEVVSFGCIAETINARLLVAILESAVDPVIVRVVRRLLKDEVVHSRFGWAFLAAERQAGRGGFLTSIWPRMIRGSVDPGLFEAGPDPIDAEGIAHGELTRAVRLTLFEEACRHLLQPGFEAMGLAA